MVSSTSPLNSRQAWTNLALATAAFTVAFAAWSVISPLSRQIQADYKLDNTAVALLIAVPTVLGALMRVPMGILTDRFGGRSMFTGLLLFTLLPVAFLGIAHSYWTYVLGAFFLGTAGASFSVGVPFVSRWFTPDKQGMALGIYGVGNVGTAAAVFATAPLVHAFGGRQGAFWFYLIPVTIMAIVFWLFARDAPGMVEPAPLGASLTAVGREPISWHLGLFYFTTFGGFVFFANYLPQLLGDWFPSDRQDATLQAAIFTMGATVARPLGGWLADQMGGAKVLMWVFGFVALTRLVLAWEAGSANIVIVTDLLLLVAVGFGIGNGAVFKLVAQYFPKNTGLAGGLVGAAGGLGGFFPPLIMGVVRDHTGSYALGFIVLATLAAICLALLLASPQKLPAAESAGLSFSTNVGRPSAVAASGKLVQASGPEKDTDRFGHLVNFLLYRQHVRPRVPRIEDSADHVDTAKLDARSVIAILEGRDTADLADFHRFEDKR
jgi:MFS transporter, NNP family, nitrate/nitrite transporter